tara:strand:+ start:80 stop:640 length:561 start_codon:yes stop_codon:yes gene_type:complete
MLIKCDVCNKEFIPKSIKNKRCSELCRRRKWADWKSERDAQIRRDVYINAPVKECRYCGGEFKAVPEHKVFCSKDCAGKYVKPKGKNQWGKPKEHPLSNYTVKIKKETLEEKIQHQKEIDVAMKLFLEKGGVITKLDPVPDPVLPSVGSYDWGWEELVGLGIVGCSKEQAVDLAEAEMMLSSVDVV